MIARFCFNNSFWSKQSLFTIFFSVNLTWLYDWLKVCFSIDMDKNIEVLENDRNLHADDFYVKFKEKLVQTHSFPTDYIFKYIVPSDQSKIARLHSIFENSNGSISSRDSRNGKFTSVTIKVPVNDADDIIIYYRQAAVIEDIVML